MVTAKQEEMGCDKIAIRRLKTAVLVHELDFQR